MWFRCPVALCCGAFLLMSVTPPAGACPWKGRHSRPVYYAPPMYVVPTPHVHPAEPPSTAGASIAAVDNRFNPPTLTVQPGTTVRWVNSGRHPHTVTDRGGKFDSGDITPGADYTVTFQTPGTYQYYCKHHKGMEGTVVVGDPARPPAPKPGPSPAPPPEPKPVPKKIGY
ncbi:MAG TPA: plastocyanin/azurin family copper-binding protein [Gemmataceae bacterium]|jgi:plastocyanin|nr:plastocyanin/azurin family copper-binding protein [Gemmataceae bacterium]